MKVTLRQVQESIANIANRATYTEDILYELLAAYGRSPNAITQLRTGQTNRATENGEVLQKDVVYFKVVPAGTQLEHAVEELDENTLTQRYKPRYLIVTDLKNLAAKDTLNSANTPISIKLADIDSRLSFFWGWTGDEMTDPKTEAQADRRAADKMNQLYTVIEKLNREKLADPTSNFRHELNVFFTRLLFCFFAEDTGLFNDKQFTNAVKLTQMDGSDLRDFFTQLFTALDSPDSSHMSVPYSGFPYVNGSLFNTSKHAIAIPEFNHEARHLILECCGQNWGEINPDIFGTMFQGVVDPDHRDENGMDYTSVPNIMKVIEPLFLNGLWERYYEIENTPSSLRELLERVRSIKVFDPACGSGNFLIIAYKELRQLESVILVRLTELKLAKRKKPMGSTNLFTNEQMGAMKAVPDPMSLFTDEQMEAIESDTVEVKLFSGIDLENFYGIEIDDFAHELAILSLYLAKHQMDSEFEKQFPVKLKHLPLIENKNIVKANAARKDWNEVCENNGTDEIYLIGNPPYKGKREQSTQQKLDLKIVLEENLNNYSSLDFIAVWFYLGSEYIRGTNAKLAFVTTNSLTQGEQVGIFWPNSLRNDVEIGFAHTSFKWQNSARDVAGVTVAIISLRGVSKQQKVLISDNVRHNVENINYYLSESDAKYISKQTTPISFSIRMQTGSRADDNKGDLIFTEQDINDSGLSSSYFREIIGGDEFINGRSRYALWIQKEDLKDMPSPILSRLDNIKKKRSNYWEFKKKTIPDGSYIFVPQISSERREYIPMGILGSDILPLDPHFFVDGGEPWLFALLQSKMHMAWIRTVCGQLETRIRYSSTLGYNTFPVQPLTETQKAKLNQSARAILLARAAHPDKTLATMYDPDKMPAELREAHDANDRLVDSLYKPSGFTNDEDRLTALFNLYEQMTAKSK